MFHFAELQHATFCGIDFSKKNSYKNKRIFFFINIQKAVAYGNWSVLYTHAHKYQITKTANEKTVRERENLFL